LDSFLLQDDLLLSSLEQHFLVLDLELHLEVAHLADLASPVPQEPQCALASAAVLNDISMIAMYFFIIPIIDIK